MPLGALYAFALLWSWLFGLDFGWAFQIVCWLFGSLF